MKAIKILPALALGLLTLTATSCGGSKKAVADVTNPEQIDGAVRQLDSKSQQLAQRKPLTRTWGVGTAPDKAFAQSIAEADARRKYAASIGTIVNGAIERSNDMVKKAATDDKKTVNVGDFGQITQEDVKNIIDNIAVSGTVVINSDTYKTKNGQYEVYTCIEFVGDQLDLEKDLVKEYRKSLEQKVSDADRDKLEDRIGKFKQEINDILEKRARQSKIGAED